MLARMGFDSGMARAVLVSVLGLALTFAGHSSADDGDAGRAAYAAGDYARAAALLRPVAEVGDLDAQFIVGFLHDTGRGVEQDAGEAVRWYRLAAERGHARAQHNLGLALAAGRGAERDQPAAAEWFRRAAEQDFGPAQFALGELCAKGEGIAADPLEAHLWFALAERHKVEGARKRRRQMADSLTPREIALAEMQERHWKQRFKNGGSPTAEEEP